MENMTTRSDRQSIDAGLSTYKKKKTKPGNGRIP